MICPLIFLILVTPRVWSQDRPHFCQAFVDNDQEVGYYSLSGQGGPQLFIGEYYWQVAVNEERDTKNNASLWPKDRIGYTRINASLPSENKTPILAVRDQQIHRQHGQLIARLIGAREPVRNLFVYNKDKVLSACYGWEGLIHNLSSGVRYLDFQAGIGNREWFTL